jgi:methyl-accepting chemotaxis protein
MNDEAKQVGGVITIIEGITAQTGLLALNATIEAARAGDAGRGFAVVAEEVSSLSKRAAHATRDITGQIQLIASKVGSVVEGMKDTGGRIDDVAQVATTIAGAIAEQRAAAEDIRQEVLSLATHADDVRDRMSGLADAADAAQTLMGGVANTADRVNSQAASLKQVTSLFLSSIRAA